MPDGKEDKKTKKLRFSWMDKNDSVENETNSTHSKTEETDHIDITGGTGGTGGAGPSAKVTTTGTPDGVRDKRNTSTSLENTFQRMKATQLKILQGATGGVGMHGDLSPEKLMELYDRQIAKMDLETALNNLQEQYHLAEADFLHADYTKATRAVELGKLLLHLKELHKKERKKKKEDNKKEDGKMSWEDFLKKWVPYLTPRTCQKYTRIASMDDVWNYTYLGIERLNLIAGALPKSERLRMVDPIGKILSHFEIRLDEMETLEELQIRVDAVFAFQKMEMREIKARIEDVNLLYDAGHRLEDSDYKSLAMVRENPDKVRNYLNGIVEHDGNRKQLLGLFEEEMALKRVKNINVSAQQLSDALKLILKAGSIQGEVNFDSLLSLANQIHELHDRFNCN